MIALPPGVTVNYFIAIEIDRLTDEMIEWFEMIGGEVTYKMDWDWKGRESKKPLVKYGKGKQSYWRQDGSGGVRLNFHGDDASTASVFIVKFFEHVQQHNLNEKHYV
jgi:hypothetical protein